MLTISPQRATQMELDFETDRARIERQNWQRAVDHNLHALQDYVRPHQALVWQPGQRKRGPDDSGYRAFNVQVVTATSCTCQRFRLREHCEHVTFLQRITAAGMTLTEDAPVRATDIQESKEVEVAA